MFLVIEKKTLHLFRIHFDTFSYDIITKDLKANFVDKMSHFGGTAGLFTGFSFITVFEILVFLFALLYNLCTFKKKMDRTSNIGEERQKMKQNNEQIKKDILHISQRFEDIEKESIIKTELDDQKFDEIERRLNNIENQYSKQQVNNKKISWLSKH